MENYSYNIFIIVILLIVYSYNGYFQRDANPEKFSSRLFNKTQYVKIGLQKAFFERTCKDLWKRIELEVDGRVIELPNIEGIIILNLLRSFSSKAYEISICR